MNWLDALLIVFAVSLVALVIERRWFGALAAACAVVLLGPLLRLGLGSPLLALGVAVAVGVVIALFSRRLEARSTAGAVFAGITGFVLAGATVVAVSISLPLGRTPDGRVVYPAQDLPAGIQAAANGSQIVAFGRSVLLQPLLATQPNSDAYSQLEFTGWLHDWLVPGEPWLVD